MAVNFFIKGAIILTISSGLARFLGFFYRIFISRTLGAEGMGIYQMVLPIYVMALTITSSGIILSLSKLISQEKARGNYVNIYKITRAGFFLVGLSGIAVSIVIYVSAHFLAFYILREHRTYIPILVLIPGIIFSALSSTLKGFFLGMQDIKPPAESQVIEQAVKLGLCAAFLKFFLLWGTGSSVAFVVSSMVLGEIVGFAHLIFYYTRIRLKFPPLYIKREEIKPYRRIIGDIISTALPISVSRITGSLFHVVEAVLVPRSLQAAGMTPQRSIALFGKLTGMAVPLILLPSIMTSSMAMTLIPEISEDVSLNNWKGVKAKTIQALKLTSIISYASASLFIVLGKSVGLLIYGIALVGEFLPFLAAGSIFLYHSAAISSVFRGLGDQITPLKNSLITSLVMVASIYYLIPVPQIGLKGYLLGFVISSLIGFILNLRALNRRVNIIEFAGYWFFMPLIPSAVFGVVLFLIYSASSPYIREEIVRICLALFTGLPVYLVFAVRYRILKIEDIRRIMNIKIWFNQLFFG